MLARARNVGYGWWNFVDEPSTGRWPDGENSNYGLRTLADDPYTILTGTMARVHAGAKDLHSAGPRGRRGAAATPGEAQRGA